MRHATSTHRATHTSMQLDKSGARGKCSKTAHMLSAPSPEAELPPCAMGVAGAASTTASGAATTPAPAS
eukprot:12775435-Alexandrium_andersonii.AAC.1